MRVNSHKRDELAAVFRALADPTRLQILALLARRGEMFQKRLVHEIGRDQPAVSRHLAYLKRTRLVLERHEGRFVYVRLGAPSPAVLETLSWFSSVASGGIADDAMA